jgi:hypothetical protein
MTVGIADGSNTVKAVGLDVFRSATLRLIRCFMDVYVNRDLTYRLRLDLPRDGGE